MKKILLLALLCVLIFNVVSAVEVTQFPDNVLPETDSQTAADQQLVLQKLAVIDAKLNTYATKNDLTERTDLMYAALLKDFQYKTDTVILATVFINLFVMGLVVSIYFYLKSRGRL